MHPRETKPGKIIYPLVFHSSSAPPYTFMFWFSTDVVGNLLLIIYLFMYLFIIII